MRPHDVVLLNIGLHHNNPADLTNAVEAFLTWYAQRKLSALPRSLPTLIWRDTTPQHFPKSPGGSYAQTRTRRSIPNLTIAGAPPSCVDIPLEEMHQFEWRNKVATPMVAAHNISVLPTWRPAAGQGITLNMPYTYLALH
eukprot:7380998-Pyramimonas_sp.AAC.1